MENLWISGIEPEESVFRIDNPCVYQSNIQKIFSSKPTVSTDGLQTKAILSWEQVDRAMLYGIERRRLSASSETDFWLEVANIERTTFIDRSIYETGRYVYRIVAKLPGVMNSEAGTQSEEVFITVQNVLDEGGSKSRFERRVEQQHRYPEDSDASTSSSVQSLLDSGK